MRMSRLTRGTINAITRRLPVLGRRRIDGFDVRYTADRGRGVFAIRPYGAGDVLMPILGTPTAARSAFSIQIGTEAHVAPGPPLRFANHSCDPNGGIRRTSDGRLALHAMRAIAAGEEITWDYAMSEADFVIDGTARHFRCRCGTTSCRGIIALGFGGLSAEHRRRYAGWIMPYLAV
jgi:uncharacterized protein